MRKSIIVFALLALEASCVSKVERITAPPRTDPTNDQRVPEYESCGPNKVCVPPSLCTSGAVNTDGDQLISSRSEKCPNILQCCLLPTDMGSEPYSEMRPPPPPLGCGYRNPNGVLVQLDRPNDEAEFGEFPWTVAIYVNQNTYHCGGSLLHPRVVLTAAHRVYNRRTNNIKVRAGDWVRNSEYESLPHQDREVQTTLVHKEMRLRTFENNVALLILKTAFDLTQHISTICLPPGGLSFDNSNCFVTGWGKTHYTSKRYSDILKKVALKVVPKATCETNLQSALNNTNFKLKASHMCAGGEAGVDACLGDGGSALVCPMPDSKTRFYQVGVVSAGFECGKKDVPGIYADIANLRPWIERAFQAYNFNTTFLPQYRFDGKSN